MSNVYRYPMHCDSTDRMLESIEAVKREGLRNENFVVVERSDADALYPFLIIKRHAEVVERKYSGFVFFFLISGGNKSDFTWFTTLLKMSSERRKFLGYVQKARKYTLQCT